MTEYYTVKNWERFQHYKDRSPPWIKLHFELLASQDWVMLADASKLLMIVCMMIASRNNGKIPADPNYLKRVAYLDKLPNLTPLLNCGFLLNTLADASRSKHAQADARPEEEVQEEDKKEKNTKKENLSGFDLFWEKFPRKRRGGKVNAETAWNRAMKISTAEEILNGLDAYLGSPEVSAGFAKGAAAWLNDERWTCDYSPAAPLGHRPAKLPERKSNVVTL